MRTAGGVQFGLGGLVKRDGEDLSAADNASLTCTGDQHEPRGGGMRKTCVHVERDAQDGHSLLVLRNLLAILCSLMMRGDYYEED